jgi:hypothetical protein
MPKKQSESLESVKLRLAREQKSRTDRRVEELLQEEQRLRDIEVCGDSEEEDRLLLRRRRGNKEQATQTDSSSLSLCCDVFVGVVVVVCLLFCSIAGSENDRQRMAR